MSVFNFPWGRFHKALNTNICDPKPKIEFQIYKQILGVLTIKIGALTTNFGILNTKK